MRTYIDCILVIILHISLMFRQMRAFAEKFNEADADNFAVIQTELLNLDPTGSVTGTPAPLQVYFRSMFILGAAVRYARTGNALPLLFADGSFMESKGLVSDRNCLSPVCILSLLLPTAVWEQTWATVGHCVLGC
jgi:hypothetical protein